MAATTFPSWMGAHPRINAPWTVAEEMELRDSVLNTPISETFDIEAAALKHGRDREGILVRIHDLGHRYPSIRTRLEAEAVARDRQIATAAGRIIKPDADEAVEKAVISAFATNLADGVLCAARELRNKRCREAIDEYNKLLGAIKDSGIPVVNKRLDMRKVCAMRFEHEEVSTNG